METPGLLGRSRITWPLNETTYTIFPRLCGIDEGAGAGFGLIKSPAILSSMDKIVIEVLLFLNFNFM